MEGHVANKAIHHLQEIAALYAVPPWGREGVAAPPPVGRGPPLVQLVYYVYRVCVHGQKEYGETRSRGVTNGSGKQYTEILCDDHWPALPPAIDADANAELFSSRLVPALQV
jgi:hypothetical protein